MRYAFHECSQICLLYHCEQNHTYRYNVCEPLDATDAKRLGQTTQCTLHHSYRQKTFNGKPPKFPCWYDMCPVLFDMYNVDVIQKHFCSFVLIFKCTEIGAPPTITSSCVMNIRRTFLIINKESQLHIPDVMFSFISACNQ